MGVMIDGNWEPDGQLDRSDDGSYQRSTTTFRDWISPDGKPADWMPPTVTPQQVYPAETDRYHLYVAINCPWCHRALLYRSIKQLGEAVGLSMVRTTRTAQGWIFAPDEGRVDNVFGYEAIHQLYSRADPNYTGRVTVPVLWDRKRDTILNNESSEIIRMFNAGFRQLDDISQTPDYYPPEHRDTIDRLNERIYNTVNNGVYKCGFAGTQQAYEQAFDALFKSLDWLDDRLETQRFLCGDRPTEADWRLLPTLVRFDAAYLGAFKCNLRRLVDYSNLWPYTRDLFQTPGVAKTIDIDEYKRGYYSSHNIVPKGPALDFEASHNRAET
jgi:putative glutathione S-transferase